MNVLVTSASRKVALVRTFREALAREGGGRVIAADVSPLSAALYHADDGVIVPPSDDASDFVPAVLDLCRRYDVRLVVPTRDEELPVFAAARETFEAVGARVMVGSPDTIHRCQDKAAFIEGCGRAGVTVPRVLDRASARRQLPVFARPRTGKGSVGATKVETVAALDALEADAIVQAFVALPEFTIDLFADFSGRVISIVPRERVRVLAGESFVSRTVKVPALIDAARRVAAAFHLVGHNTLQCFFDGATPSFIEVNPRYGGAAQLGFAAGANTPWFLVRLAMGHEVPVAIGEFTEGLVMLRYTDDVFLSDGELAHAE